MGTALPQQYFQRATESAQSPIVLNGAESEIAPQQITRPQDSTDFTISMGGISAYFRCIRRWEDAFRPDAQIDAIDMLQIYAPAVWDFTRTSGEAGIFVLQTSSVFTDSIIDSLITQSSTQTPSTLFTSRVPIEFYRELEGQEDTDSDVVIFGHPKRSTKMRLKIRSRTRGTPMPFVESDIDE